MVCRLLSFVLVFCIMVSALQAQEPGDWDDASTNWEEFKETLTLEKIVADLSVFALAIKKYLDEHDDLPDEFYHVDPDLVEKN